jgi:gentisate 1,2-dioxygenase
MTVDAFPQPLPDSLVTHPSSARWLDPAVTGNPSRIGALRNVPSRTMEFYLQELPPGAAGDLQRHRHESVHVVLDGCGYSEIGDRTVHWSAGDLVYTPPWIWHRHYNDGADTVRMLLVENSRLLAALGLNERESAGERKASEIAGSPLSPPHTES